MPRGSEDNRHLYSRPQAITYEYYVYCVPYLLLGEGLAVFWSSKLVAVAGANFSACGTIVESTINTMIVLLYCAVLWWHDSVLLCSQCFQGSLPVFRSLTVPESYSRSTFIMTNCHTYCAYIGLELYRWTDLPYRVDSIRLSTNMIAREADIKDP